MQRTKYVVHLQGVPYCSWKEKLMLIKLFIIGKELIKMAKEKVWKGSCSLSIFGFQFYYQVPKSSILFSFFYFRFPLLD
jgi:hypothetical protein